MSQDPIPEAWLTFVGIIDLQVARSITAEMISAVQAGIRKVHFLIQSPGGNVSEGVYLYNFFRSLPLEVVAYNHGIVGSAAAVAFLGAKERVVSPHSVVMFHRAKAAAGVTAQSHQMVEVAASLEIDDARIEAIIRENANLSPKQWRTFHTADLTLDASSAIKTIVATSLGTFRPHGVLRSI